MSDPASDRNVVLIVDDELSVLRAATLAVSRLGYRALVAENGAAGLKSFLAAADEIGLVLTDIVMPFMNGIEMAGRILALRPDTKILLMTGYSDRVIQPIANRKLQLIGKPFLHEDLARAIRSAFELKKAAQQWNWARHSPLSTKKGGQELPASRG